MRQAVPPQLPLDLYAGQAWIAVVPFRMSAVRPRFVPPLPWLSAFPELNVRTYVTLNNKPGVYFFSLDAANPLAVQIARATFNLPYFNAQMSLQETDWVAYASRRAPAQAPGAEFKGRYRPVSAPYESQKGTLENWLTERYCLYSLDRSGRVYRGEIQHLPWPLQKAEAEIQLNTMTLPPGLPLPAQPPLLHFVRRLDVVVWPITPV